MSNNNELKPESLYTRTDPGILHFETTDELQGLGEVIGQARAIDAIEFGTEIEKSGFNIFVLGPSGVGKQSTVLQYLSAQAASRETPSDWCYVNNFDHPQRPLALQLPAGKGQELSDEMRKLIRDTRTSMPVTFESNEYRAKHEEIQEKYESRRAEAFRELSEDAAAHGVSLIKDKHGFELGPIVDGKTIDVADFSKLPKDTQEHLTEVIEIYEEKLSALIHRMPQLAREESEEIQTLNHNTAIVAVDSLIRSLIEKYSNHPEVCRYLNNVKNDIAMRVDDFLDHNREAVDFLGMMSGEAVSFKRYEVNLLIDNKKTKGAPVIYEDNPVYQKLIGRVEHESRMGALVTDLTHIKTGERARLAIAFAIPVTFPEVRKRGGMTMAKHIPE